MLFHKNKTIGPWFWRFQKWNNWVWKKDYVLIFEIFGSGGKTRLHSHVIPQREGDRAYNWVWNKDCALYRCISTGFQFWRNSTKYPLKIITFVGKVIITFVGGSKLLHLWVKCIITFVGEIITFVGKVLLHLWALLHLWVKCYYICGRYYICG